MVSSPHGFIIYWIEIFKDNEKVTEVVDVENLQTDNSKVLRWVVSLIERNSPVSLMKFSIQTSSIQLALVVLVTTLASVFVFGFAPLESSLSQLVLLSAPLGLHLVSTLVHVESVVVHL
ncbi:hypothetical protein Tco_0746836 [Tanacetum coccineum]